MPNVKPKPQRDVIVQINCTKRNVARYYWWSLKQWLFWHSVHKPIGEYLKKHTDLNKAPYPIQGL